MLEKKCWNWQGLITAALKSGIWEKGRRQQKSLEQVPEQDEPAMLQSLQNMQL